MVEVLIGRVGEKETYSFSLDDIKRGAVRESGLFSELFKTKLPPMVSGVLVSGAEHKLYEQRLATKEFDFPIYLPPSVLPKALEDSKEEQTDQVNITKAKIQRGFLSPVFSLASTLEPVERAEFLNGIVKRAQTDSLENLIIFADDRMLRMDPVFLEPLFGNLRNHSNEQVREIFTEGHPTPGKRVKEVDGANLGIVNSVYRYHQVVKGLIREGVKFDGYQYMDTTLCFVPMVAKGVPLPENGLVIQAIGAPRELREVTDHDVRQVAKGRIFTYDDFDKPVGEDFPDWMTIRALKESVSLNQSRVEQATYDNKINKEKALEYLTEVYSPGVAIKAFVHALEIPKKGTVPSIRPKFEQTQQPENILTTGSFLSGSLDEEDLRNALSVNSGKKVKSSRVKLTLRKLEEEAHTAQAFAVVNSNRYQISDEDIKKFGSKDNLSILRELETSLVAAYLITMSTQAGASQHIGRPHLVHRSWYKHFGMYHPDFCNLGLTGDDEKQAYHLYDSKKEIEQGLNSFDKTTYQHNVDVPKDEFKSTEDLKEKFSIKETDYVVAGYGSSSGFADETYTHQRELFYQMSKKKNAVLVMGGGTRSGMKGMMDGTIQALKEGYPVKLIGIRSETDVSPLEGSVEDYFKEQGYPLAESLEDKDLLRAANGEIQIYKQQRILPRQSSIAQIADAVVLGDGGKGTALEFFITAVHNAKCNLTGEGLLGHTRRVPLIVMNREIKVYGTKRGMYDVLLGPYRGKEQLIGLKEMTGKNPVPQTVEFLFGHAKGREMIFGQEQGHNFDLSEQVLPNPSSKEPAFRPRAM